MRTLELFCGENKSFSEFMKIHDNSCECITLDFNKKTNPTICEDILKWDYSIYAPGYFDIIWASPDCVNYSVIQYTHKHRKSPEQIEENLKYSDSLVIKMLEIIKYFNPPVWYIENPNGLMKTRECMKPYKDNMLMCDYCMYSDWGYRKRTCIWTNKSDVCLKTCDKKCNNMIMNPKSGRLNHKMRLGFTKEINPDKSSRADKHRIPIDLIKDLII